MITELAIIRKIIKAVHSFLRFFFIILPHWYFGEFLCIIEYNSIFEDKKKGNVSRQITQNNYSMIGKNRESKEIDGK